MAKTQEEVDREFYELVNMAPAELERWLATETSKKVGAKPAGGGESVGHASGRMIVKILRTRKKDLTALQHAHMRKVVGYIKRHKAQGPARDILHSKWRYSLMNWGHDPAK